MANRDDDEALFLRTCRWIVEDRVELKPLYVSTGAVRSNTVRTYEDETIRLTADPASLTSTDLSIYDALEPGDYVVTTRNFYNRPHIHAGTIGRVADGADPVHTSVHGALIDVVFELAAGLLRTVCSDTEIRPVSLLERLTLEMR